MASQSAYGCVWVVWRPWPFRTRLLLPLLWEAGRSRGDRFLRIARSRGGTTFRRQQLRDRLSWLRKHPKCSDDFSMKTRNEAWKHRSPSHN